MGFKNRGFGRPTYQEKSQEPERVIIISCEGRNTEPEYFNLIKSKLSQHISVLLEIHIVEKNDNRSEPKDVINHLEKYLQDKYDYKKHHDEEWLVIDRESVESRKNHILEILDECKKKAYQIALTNPLFEFWLLLHVVDISKYNNRILYENRRVNSKRRYIDKELSNILDNGYNKKKGRFNHEIVSIENIKKALQQEKFFSNKLENIIDNLGSNVGCLIEKIINI